MNSGKDSQGPRLKKLHGLEKVSVGGKRLSVSEALKFWDICPKVTAAKTGNHNIPKPCLSAT